MTVATGPAVEIAPANTTVATSAPAPKAGGEPEYLPQFKITDVPVVPAKMVLAKIEYPPLAAKQGIEANVFLELFIDDTGKIRKITVLKDPGYGFAQAAIAALSDITCTPAMVDGQPVAVRFRYPVRFTLK
jgi:protein TonB